MDWRKLIHTLYLDYDLLVDQNVDSVPAIQMDTFVLDRNRILQAEPDVMKSLSVISPPRRATLCTRLQPG